MSAEKERDKDRKGERSRKTNERRRERQGKRKGWGGGENRWEKKSVAATISGRVYLGPMTRVSQHCKALRFPSEPLNCCHNGKVSLPLLGDYPLPLKDLFTGSNTAESSNFQDNSAFSFASLKLICRFGLLATLYTKCHVWRGYLLVLITEEH